MSYHVHGYKIEGLSLIDLHIKLKKIQSKAREIGKNFIHKAVMKKVCARLDHHKASLSLKSEYNPKKDPMETPLYFVKKEIEKDQQDLKRGVRSPLISMELDVCIYPLTNTSFIMAIYTEREEYSSLFIEEGFVPYGYQNSTDKPKEVSSREWSQREKNWDKLIAKGTPSENGFSFSVVKQYDVFFLDDKYLMSNIPSKEDRAKNVFSMMGLSLKNQQDKIVKEFEMKDLMDFIWWTKDEKEGMEYVEKTTEQIKSLIPDSYTLTEILGFERKKNEE